MSITDQLNRSINVSFPPEKIVSLVPSQTELLYDLGLDKEIIGITKFCIHPKVWFRNKQRIGGTKTVNISLIKELQPDLIIANKEENVKEQIEELQQIAPVWVSNIKTFEDALEMILSVGKLTNREEPAKELVFRIKGAFELITPVCEKIRTAYLIWKNPYMAAGGDTFIHEMLGRCGLTNVFKHINRYPEISVGASSITTNHQSTSATNTSSSVNSYLSTIDSSLTNCQLLLLSSEPYPFKQKHINELQTMLPRTKIMLVDGEMFSWYGSRLLYAAEYFRNLIKEIQG
jgi:ABC-type Fe3+-citrate transport system substrate-binding protein